MNWYMVFFTVLQTGMVASSVNLVMWKKKKKKKDVSKSTENLVPSTLTAPSQF